MSGRDVSLPDNIALGHWAFQFAYVAARLGVGDQLAKGPMHVEALARAVGAQQRPLFRVLRALESLDILSQPSAQTFALTSRGESLLRSDVPGSQMRWILMQGEVCWDAWHSLLGSVREGGIAFDRAHGKPVYMYVQDHPHEAGVLNDAMVEIMGFQVLALCEGYDMSRFKKIVDVGAGKGQLMIEVLKRNPNARGVTFDLPYIAEAARRALAAAGVGDRCECAGGDFFESVPAGGDLYIGSTMISNWDGDQAIKILTNVNRAMAPGGTLVLFENVVPEGNQFHFAKFLDVQMMVMTGGTVRTEAEFRTLYDTTGFELVRVIPTRGPASIVEGRKR